MRTHYTAKQKAQIVLEILKEERSVSQIASAYGIHTNQLYKWKARALEGLPDVFDDERKGEKELKASYEHQLEELYAEIGRLSTQLAWLKKKSGLERIEN
jgi:transposase-like protein